MANRKRTTHRSTANKKLYAVRDEQGKFEDIQTYQRAHSMDTQRTSQEEAAKREELAERAKAEVDVVDSLSVPTTDQPQLAMKPNSDTFSGGEVVQDIPANQLAKASIKNTSENEPADKQSVGKKSSVNMKKSSTKSPRNVSSKAASPTKTSQKKTAAKKTAAKKTAAKKPAQKKASPKKTASKQIHSKASASPKKVAKKVNSKKSKR